jgi:hypothetical protein
MLAAVSRVSGTVLWANLHLLFWLSLIPFSTAWMSEHRFPPIPTAVYGIVLLAAAIAYLILQTALLRAEGDDSSLRTAIGSDAKGKISALLYCLGIGLVFVNRWLGLAVYVAVALIWLVADRRVERHLTTVRPSRSNRRAANRFQTSRLSDAGAIPARHSRLVRSQASHDRQRSRCDSALRSADGCSRDASHVVSTALAGAGRGL